MFVLNPPKLNSARRIVEQTARPLPLVDGVGALPAHLRLADGTVQISNQLSFGEAGGFSRFTNGPFTIERWGPGGSSKVTEQWGTDAVEAPLQVVALQTIYRKAFAAKLIGVFA